MSTDLLRQCRDYLRHLATGPRMPAVEQELRREIDRAVGPDQHAAGHGAIAAACRLQFAGGLPMVAEVDLRCPRCGGEEYFEMRSSVDRVGSCSRCGVLRGIAPNGGSDASNTGGA